MNYNLNQVRFNNTKEFKNKKIKSILGEASGGMSRDEYIDNTAADILKRIPPQYDTVKVWKKFGGEAISPTSVVLLQELDRFNNLTMTMSKSLTTLRRALKGEVGMSNELDDLSRALYNGQLPPMWRRLAPATKKNLATWMDHFLRRNQLYSGWVNIYFSSFFFICSFK